VPQTHPGLSSTWYRTPLDFISPYRRFRIDVHWSYYEQLTYMVKIPLFSREIKARPWDRLPSEAFLVVDQALLAPALVVLVGFSLSPLAAWNFHFPTEGEKLAWRVCSVYHAIFSIAVGLYYVYAVVLVDKQASKMASFAHCSPKVQQQGVARDRPALEVTNASKGPVCYDVEAGSATSGKGGIKIKGAVQRGVAWLRSWRNISPDGDPDMAIGVRATFLPLVGTFLYIFCRLFFYVEDFVSIRQQPVGVYTAMNKFIPFMN
jgi:hypothetical protein